MFLGTQIRITHTHTHFTRKQIDRFPINSLHPINIFVCFVLFGLPEKPNQEKKPTSETKE